MLLRIKTLYKPFLPHLPTLQPRLCNAFTTTQYMPQDRRGDDFLPGISSHAAHQREEIRKKQFQLQNTAPPPPPPGPPPPSSSPNHDVPHHHSRSPLHSYPGEEEAMPDYDEADFNDSINDEINNNGILSNDDVVASGSIRAFYVSRSIDTMAIFQKEFGSTLKPILSGNSVVLVVPSLTHSNQKKTTTPNSQITSTGGVAVDEDGVGYAVFLDFGAVIFFGLDVTTESTCLASASKFLKEPMSGTKRQEDLRYEEIPSLKKWHSFDRSTDTMSFRKLDLNTVNIVAGVIGQTVALDHYEREADALLDVFQELNQKIVRTQGERFGIEENKLYKLIAQNNVIITSTMTKLGLLDHARPGEAVWNVEEYYEVYKSLRTDYELDTRFKKLNTKCDFIADNLKFFAGTVGEKKGHNLEWIIILLIAMELGFNCYEHPELFEIFMFWKKLL